MQALWAQNKKNAVKMKRHTMEIKLEETMKILSVYTQSQWAQNK